MNEAHWTRRPERGSFLAMQLMLRLTLLLGRLLTRPVLWLIALYFMLTGGAARRASRSYLARVLPEPVRWWHVLRHFLHFAIVVQDRIFLLKGQFWRFDLQAQGTDYLHEYCQRRGGALLFGAHLGSFEAARAFSRKQQRPVSIAMYAENARQLMRTLAALNPSAADEILPLGQPGSMLAIRDRIAAGHIVGILADRNLGRDSLQPVQLLGASAGLPDGPFRLAASLRVPVFFITGLYRGGKRYDVHVELITDFGDCEPAQRASRVAQARQDYADKLSLHCRTAPYNWFNFFDFWGATTTPATEHTSTP
jgi:predicted LPLAT superfamily acyltransferase